MRCLSTIVTGKTFLFTTCNVFWTTKGWKWFLRIIHFLSPHPPPAKFPMWDSLPLAEGNQRTELWNTNHGIKRISLIGLNWQISMIMPELTRMLLRLWNTTQVNHKRPKPTLRMWIVTLLSHKRVDLALQLQSTVQK